jgi:hypothetical protein
MSSNSDCCLHGEKAIELVEHAVLGSVPVLIGLYRPQVGFLYRAPPFLCARVLTILQGPESIEE